jgi:hypothetical protein
MRNSFGYQFEVLLHTLADAPEREETPKFALAMIVDSPHIAPVPLPRDAHKK